MDIIEMGKSIQIQAIFKEDKQLFQCQPNEFLQKAAEHFNVNPNNIALFVVHGSNRSRIHPSNIKEFMKIEIVDNNDGRRSLRSYNTLQNAVNDSYVDNIITKLKYNTPLSGTERKNLVDWLPNIVEKRKHVDNDSAKVTANKRIQVFPMLKDCFTQTDDLVCITSNVIEDLDQKLQKMKRLACNTNTNKEEIKKLMNESFDDRKTFIYTKSPPVALVRDKYPLLFKFEEVINEFERHFYPGICEKFKENMWNYSKYILECCSQNDDTYLRTIKSIERAKTEFQKSYARVVGSVFALSKILEEDIHYMRLTDNPHGSSNIYPYIDASCYAQKDIYFDNVSFHILVEEQNLCDAPNFLEAILCLLASFFIFNIEYPDNCRRTMIVFEKIYLESFHTADLDEMTHQMIIMLQAKANKGYK